MFPGRLISREGDIAWPDLPLVIIVVRLLEASNIWNPNGILADFVPVWAKGTVNINKLYMGK